MARKTDAELLAEAQALDEAYARAETFDAARAPEWTEDECNDDYMLELRKAALSRGRP